MKCELCQDLGYTVVPEHGCRGDEKECERLCPVPVRVQCECGRMSADMYPSLFRNYGQQDPGGFTVPF